MMNTNTKTNTFELRRNIAGQACTLLGVLLVASPVYGAALQVDEPWQSAGDNTGTVNGQPLTASSAGDRWRGEFSNDTALYPRTDLWGANALPDGTIGDFFSLNFRTNTTDTVTITLNGSLTDPIFYLGDLDVVGSSVTVSGPVAGTNFSNNADSEWTGNTLTTLAGAGQERTGAFGTVQFLGDFDAGASFVFDIDFDFDTFSSDNMGIGVGVIPIPAAAWLFASALAGLTFLRRRVAMGRSR